MMDNFDGRILLNAMKNTTQHHQPVLCIPVSRPIETLLRPVATRKGHLNEQDVRLLTAWRNRFVKAFLTEFKADEDRTARWLTEHVRNDDTRILFMVDDAQTCETFGYMGLAFIDWEKGTGEADAVVRGREAGSGRMSSALLTLLDWARKQLSLTTFGVRVRSDNTALDFYRKLRFQEVRRVGLRRVDTPNMTQWVEDESLPAGEPSLVHMILRDTTVLE
jgi:RimJ/RimL family protein N-acetyltransferase